MNAVLENSTATMTDVVPAIIPDSLEHLEKELEKVRGISTVVQIDIADGLFAPTTTWPLHERDRIDAIPFPDEFNFELDMMVEKPAEGLDDWVSAGVEAFIAHVESNVDLETFIQSVRSFQKRVGLAFVPSTDVNIFEKYIPSVDFVQIMGNDKIGFHGVELDERVYTIAKDLREQFPSLTIAVDIGVNFETAPMLVAAGVNKLVSGSALFNSSNIAESYSKMKAL